MEIRDLGIFLDCRESVFARTRRVLRVRPPEQIETPPIHGLTDEEVAARAHRAATD